MKRAVDVILVAATIPLWVPLIAMLALAISLDGGRPLYRQIRIGRNGRHFAFWKLRSMVPDAERKLKAFLDCDEAARTEWAVTQKLKNDPRITPIGRLLRKSSLDELPQLWNVLRGDMSLVGPRPMLPEQMPLYPGRAYFQMAPGLTGFWQISDRNNSSFASRAEFDAAYAECMSLRVDLMVLARTVGVVVRGTGW